MNTLRSLAIGLVASSAIFLTSCEKEIDLNIKGADDKLVVQASIERQIDPYTGDEEGLPPIVVLTKSISFFGDLDSAALAEIFVHDAEVYVSDGTQEVKLKEYDFRFAPGQAIESAYFYSLDTSAGSPLMFGEMGTNYTLRIEWQGETYTSSSMIRPPVPIDSFWVQEPKNVNYDTTYYEVRARYTDPIEKPQYYYFMVNSKYQYQEPTSYEDVFNDEVVNGVSLNFTFDAADFDDENNQRGYFIQGDTIEVNWSAIDYEAYEFYNTKSFSGNSIGNPFATPVNVLGNISNGALGSFVARGTYVYNYVIQP